VITTVGRFFGIFPFSVAEILLGLIIIGGLVGLVLFVIFVIKRKKIISKTVLWTSCVASTLLLIYITNCGIMYNRQTFLHGSGADFYRHENDEEQVFMMILQEFLEKDLLSQITTDENGVFKMTGDLSKTAPAAMRNLAETFPRLDVYYPRPKPLTRIGSEIMTAGWITGVFSPFTVEANYNGITPYGERILTALHELVHAAGFMREDEANFISFLAAKESGDPELEYAAYLYAFYRLGHYSWCDETDTSSIPEQVWHDMLAEDIFWWSRLYIPVFCDDGEIIDYVTNPVVDIISDVTSAVNDAYLQAQGVDDGVLSYGRAIDLIIAYYLIDTE
jgi:hypothetical protein